MLVTNKSTCSAQEYIFQLHELYFSSLDDEKQQDLVDQRRRGLTK